jgi:hypothetical protein
MKRLSEVVRHRSAAMPTRLLAHRTAILQRPRSGLGILTGPAADELPATNSVSPGRGDRLCLGTYTPLLARR